MDKMPRWADVFLTPLISLILAFFVSGLVVLYIGEDPFRAVSILIEGSIGSAYAWGYTLYYATNFIFTGLAVAIAFHARMFNIGGEGQAAIGGLGVALVCLMIPWPHWALALPVAVAAGAIFGAGWAAVPAYLQARRGSHIVITTIMFNFIAAALLAYVIVEVLKAPGQMSPESSAFNEGSNLPRIADFLRTLGLACEGRPLERVCRAPLNIAFILALLACFGVWLLIWRTRFGFELRALDGLAPVSPRSNRVRDASREVPELAGVVTDPAVDRAVQRADAAVAFAGDHDGQGVRGPLPRRSVEEGVVDPGVAEIHGDDDENRMANARLIAADLNYSRADLRLSKRDESRDSKEGDVLEQCIHFQ